MARDSRDKEKNQTDIARRNERMWSSLLDHDCQLPWT